jgi:hypothetical protein
MTDLLDFDVQASPKCVELFGWDQLRSIATEYIKETPDVEWYPEKWFHGTPEEKAEAPEKLKILFLQVHNLVIKVLTYRDKDGIRVVSFDPARDVPDDFRIGIRDGHHRLRRKVD